MIKRAFPTGSPWPRLASTVITGTNASTGTDSRVAARGRSGQRQPINEKHLDYLGRGATAHHLPITARVHPTTWCRPSCDDAWGSCPVALPE